MILPLTVGCVFGIAWWFPYTWAYDTLGWSGLSGVGVSGGNGGLLRVWNGMGGHCSRDTMWEDGGAGLRAPDGPDGPSRRGEALQIGFRMEIVWLAQGIIESARHIFYRKVERRFTKGISYRLWRISAFSPLLPFLWVSKWCDWYSSMASCHLDFIRKSTGALGGWMEYVAV